MRYLTLLIIIICFPHYASCQIQALVYPDLESYIAEAPSNDIIEIDEHNDLDGYIDKDYNIHWPGDLRSRDFQKNTWAVESMGTLYINCTIIRYKWFAPVLYRNDRYIYFRGFMSRLKEHEMQMHMGGRKRMNRENNNRNAVGLGLLGGVGAVAASNVNNNVKMRSDRYNYLVDLQTKRVLVIDIPQMQDLLANHPELDRKYMKAGHPEDPASIIYFLKALE